MKIEVKGDIKKLENVINKLRRIDEFMIASSDKIINKTKKVLLDQNRTQMKEQGIDSMNEWIKNKNTNTYPYSKAYTAYKSKKGKNVNYVDLYLTGEFHKSISLIQMNPGEWKFLSDDEKAPWLMDAYGKDILGVEEQFLDEYSENTFRPKLQELTDKYIK